jgi:hypothetical protein
VTWAVGGVHRRVLRARPPPRPDGGPPAGGEAAGLWFNRTSVEVVAGPTRRSINVVRGSDATCARAQAGAGKHARGIRNGGSSRSRRDSAMETPESGGRADQSDEMPEQRQRCQAGGGRVRHLGRMLSAVRGHEDAVKCLIKEGLRPWKSLFQTNFTSGLRRSHMKTRSPAIPATAARTFSRSPELRSSTWWEAGRHTCRP